jgi:hypothetical protein
VGNLPSYLKKEGRKDNKICNKGEKTKEKTKDRKMYAKRKGKTRKGVLCVHVVVVLNVR